MPHVLLNLPAAAYPKMVSHPKENEVTPHTAESPPPLRAVAAPACPDTGNGGFCKGKGTVHHCFRKSKEKVDVYGTSFFRVGMSVFPRHFHTGER